MLVAVVVAVVSGKRSAVHAAFSYTISIQMHAVLLCARTHKRTRSSVVSFGTLTETSENSKNNQFCVLIFVVVSLPYHTIPYECVENLLFFFFVKLFYPFHSVFHLMCTAYLCICVHYRWHILYWENERSIRVYSSCVRPKSVLPWRVAHIRRVFMVCIVYCYYV